jgi:hypothetical protein
VERDPLTVAKCSLVEPDIGSAGLSSAREREIVPISGQVAEVVQCRRGAM